MIYRCEMPGCNAVRRERGKYCTQAHANADRQRRFRDHRDAKIEISEMVVTLSIGLKWEPRKPTVFGVETTSDVRDVFADDAVRFRHFGIRDFPIE